jgi:hypothetical protein
MTSRGVLLVGLSALAAGAACKADDPIKRPSGDEDAAPVADLPPPELQAMPESTPLTTVAARGTTDGTRVAGVGSPAGTQVTVVLPGGSFCQDTPLKTDGPTDLRYYAVAGDGRVSDPAVVTVTYDPSAPAPAMANCGGDMNDCKDAEECGSDDVDEDCNGWADQCDFACSECQDDPYEPNDLPINVPTLAAGTYDMKLCPCRDDWYAFTVDMGARIHAVVNFTTADIDIDAKLFLSGPDGQGTSGDPVATSTGTSDTETIDFTTTAAGTYFLRVYPFRVEDKPQGSYQITLD